ncbi:MAG: hypothetical protein HOJ48_17585 [Desulfobacula sp.]|nr:hypothetical protein [Desulfobacula sp.]
MKKILTTSILIIGLTVFSNVAFTQEVVPEGSQVVVPEGSQGVVPEGSEGVVTEISEDGLPANDWEQEYVEALQQGRIKTTGQYSGLGYATNDTSALDNAIKNAMESSAPPGEVIKIAVDQGYSPYSVIKKVLGHGGKIELDQLCMYSTQSDINKQVLAKAVADAKTLTAICDPIYSSDEIAQTPCLKDIGLGYTPVATAAPGRVGSISPRKDPKPFSPSTI